MIPSIFSLKAPPRPMLACAIEEADFPRLRFPFLASPKIDGYRAVAFQSTAYARSGKVHPNHNVQKLFRDLPQVGLDGELTVPGLDFNTGGGLLRRYDYSGAFLFSIFDISAEPFSNLPFANRLEMLKGLAEDLPPWAKILRQEWIENVEQLLAFEQECLSLGYEGVCLRAPYAPYKHNRGTLRDQTLLKLKRFASAEARILSVEPRYENQNPQTFTPLGYSERSTNAENLVPTNLLGTLHVEGINGQYAGVRFSIGTFLGLNDWDKIQLLKNPPIGQVCSYKFFLHDAKDAPRHPVFLGFRPDFDREEPGK